MSKTPSADTDSAENAAEENGVDRVPFTLTQKLLCALLVLASIYTIYFAQEILIPIVFATLAGIILLPLVRALARLHVPDALGAAVVIAGVLAILIGLGAVLQAPAVDWLNRWPAVLAKAQVKLYPVKKTVEKAKKVTEGIEKITETKSSPKKTVVSEPSIGSWIVDRAAGILALIGITVVMAYFMLARGRRTLTNILRSTRLGHRRRQWVEIAGDVQRDVATYILTITAINFGLGFLTTIVLFALGVPNPLLWGVLAMMLNYLPYLGALVMAIVLFAVSLLTFDSWTTIVLPPLAYLAMSVIEGNVVTPTIIGQRMTLNPLAVFVSVLFWGTLWGVPGVFVAVPVLATLRVLSEHAEGMAFLRPLLR